MSSVILWYNKAVFLYRCPDCPSCLAHSKSIGWAAWTIWEAMKKYSLNSITSSALTPCLPQCPPAIWWHKHWHCKGHNAKDVPRLLHFSEHILSECWYLTTESVSACFFPSSCSLISNASFVTTFNAFVSLPLCLYNRTYKLWGWGYSAPMLTCLRFVQPSFSSILISESAWLLYSATVPYLSIVAVIFLSKYHYTLCAHLCFTITQNPKSEEPEFLALYQAHFYAFYPTCPFFHFYLYPRFELCGELFKVLVFSGSLILHLES